MSLVSDVIAEAQGWVADFSLSSFLSLLFTLSYRAPLLSSVLFPLYTSPSSTHPPSPPTAEERQDRNEKRRKIDQQHRANAEQRKGGTHVQNGHDYVPVKPTPLPSTGLPPKPVAAAAPVDVASMVGSNASIVANRKAIRMANLSAAEMIKAELAGGGADGEKNLSAAEKLKRELKGEAGGATIEEIVEEEPAAEKEKDDETMPDAAPTETTPRGTKRKAGEAVSAPASDTEDTTEVEETEESEVDSFLSKAIVAPGEKSSKLPPLKMMGNNVVEQDDTVK